MITYEYRCRLCGLHLLTTRHGLDQDSTNCHCPDASCLGTLKRLYSFTATRPMQEHMNATVGQPIRSNRQFDEALKRKSDEMSERIGMEHRFRRIEPEQVKATDEGMDNTYRQQVATGQRETKLIL